MLTYAFYGCEIPEHVLVFLFIYILKAVYLQQLFFPLLGFLCSF